MDGPGDWKYSYISFAEIEIVSHFLQTSLDYIFCFCGIFKDDPWSDQGREVRSGWSLPQSSAFKCAQNLKLISAPKGAPKSALDRF